MSGVKDIRRVQTENEIRFYYEVLPSRLGLHSSFAPMVERLRGLLPSTAPHEDGEDGHMSRAIDLGRRIEDKLARISPEHRALISAYYNDPTIHVKKAIRGTKLEKALLAYEALSEIPAGQFEMPKKDERQISIVLLASLIGMKTNSLYIQLKRARITYRVGRESRVKLAMLKEHFPHHYQVVESARLTGIIE